MKFTFKHIVTAITLSLVMVSMVEAKKNYTTIKSMSQFNDALKAKKQTVVLFLDRKAMGKQAYNDLEKTYDKFANTERYMDKQNLQFLMVNTAYKKNHVIFEKHKVLNDGTIVEKPVILLFRNGKMIDNQLSGDMSKKRMKSFIERNFKRDPMTKKKYKVKAKAQ